MGNIMTIKHGNGVPEGKLEHYEFGYSDDKKNLYLNTPAALVVLNLGKFDINNCEEIATDGDLNNYIDAGTYICKNISSLINKPDTTATEAKLFVIKIANNEEIFQILIDNDNCIWIRTYVKEWKEWINCAEKIIVDSELSLTSINPVQNKIITAAINNKLSLEGGEINGSLIIDEGLEVKENLTVNEVLYLKNKIIFPQNNYSNGDTNNTFINQGFFINNMIPSELENQPSEYGILTNFSNENTDGHLLWMEQKDGNIYHKGYNPVYMSDNWKKILDTGNTGIPLWTGSWTTGTITIPQLNDYKMYYIDVTGANTIVQLFRESTSLRGIGGYVSNSGYGHIYVFNAEVSGTSLTYVNLCDFSLSSSGKITSSNGLGVNGIYGLL